MNEADQRLSEQVHIRQQLAKTRADTAGLRPSVYRAWRAVGWFGALLAVVGLADIIMVWIPPAFGNPTWQFGAVDMSASSLPLLTMGLAALLASAFARRAVWQLRFTGALLLVLGLGLLAIYVAFYALNVPLALNATPEDMKVGIWKSIAKTTVLTVLFPVAYVTAGIAALRDASAD